MIEHAVAILIILTQPLAICYFALRSNHFKREAESWQKAYQELYSRHEVIFEEAQKLKDWQRMIREKVADAAKD